MQILNLNIIKKALMFLVLTSLFKLSAQDYSKEKIIPPNPIASSFKVYGDIPVSYSTGVPDITIPLYKIQIGDYVLPIELKYHIKSVKPGSCASNVALGWSLHYGGIVSRTVYGEPDGSGISTYNSNIGIGCASNVELQDLFKDYQQDYKYKDTEYDIYNYDVNGKYGEFIYDGGIDGAVQLMSKQPMSIRLAGHDKINATDDHGNVYKFGYGITESTSDVTTSWLLSKIELAANRQIYFNYVDTVYYTNDFYEQLYLADEFMCIGWEQESSPVPCLGNGINPFHSVPREKKEQCNTIYHYEKNVKEINFPGGKIEFTFKPHDKRLITGMKIYQNDVLVRSYDFNVTYTGGSMDYMGLLRNITVRDNSSNINNKYQFSYYNESNISKIHSTDHWGYVNSTTILQNSFPYGLYANLAPSNDIFGTGVDYPAPWNMGLSKVANLQACMSNVLRKITYPTGGETEFEYELNEYTYGSKIQGDGLRVKKITNNPVTGSNNIKTFIYESPVEKDFDILDIDNYVTTSYAVGIIVEMDQENRVPYYGISR